MSLLDEYPLQATEDEDSALRVTLCRLLAAQTYRVPGGAVFGGFLVDFAEVPPLPPELAIYSEWSDGDTTARYPFAVILDATGTYGSTPANEDYIPIEEGGSLWTPLGTDGIGPAVTLRALGDYEVTLSVQLQADNRATRSALVRGARSALTPSASDAETGRSSLVVNVGALYWNRRARFQVVGLTRTDTEASGGQKLRSAIITVRATIPVVEPVEIDLLRHVEFTPPGADSGLGGF